jgi:hypothetical protein
LSITLLEALVATAPIGTLLFGSVVLFVRGKSLGSFLQLLGAGRLVIVVLAHICGALHLFPWMRWGDPHSAGHYIDFGSAVLGLTLFPRDIYFTRFLKNGD